MKIGELKEHCGDCPLIDYCTDPYETPQLCCINCIEDVETSLYIDIAENLTYEEIKKKEKSYEDGCSWGWTNENRGAICELVIDKLNSNNGEGE